MGQLKGIEGKRFVFATKEILKFDENENGALSKYLIESKATMAKRWNRAHTLRKHFRENRGNAGKHSRHYLNQGHWWSEMEVIWPLLWYPKSSIWQLNYAAEKELNPWEVSWVSFLNKRNEVKNTTMQEAVSLVPPPFLDESLDYCVLDMCAASGSKISQLLEIVTDQLNQDATLRGKAFHHFLFSTG